MRAAVLYQPNTPLEVQEVEIVPPRQGEVLVRVAAAGICHSDLHYIKGDLPHPLPVVLGHEGAGVVEAVGPGVTSVRPGDHVILVFRPHCGQCYYCLRGRPALCDFGMPIRTTGKMLDGTSRIRRNGQEIHHFTAVSCFAEYAVLPEQGVLRIRPDIPLDRAALVGCAVTTGVGAVLYNARVEEGSSVLVIGAGGVGLNVVQGAVLAGANPIIVADVVPSKLEYARQFGATHTINAREQDVVAVAKELTEGRGVDYAFEVIGLVKTMEQGYEAIRKGGTFVIVGVAPANATMSFSPLWMMRDEKTIKATNYGSANIRKDMPILLDLYLAGRLKLDELITRRFTLDQINDAFAALERGEVARGVIAFER